MGVFRFKGFEVDDCGCGMKICSDSVLLAAWFLKPYRNAVNILDVGAGSGVLSMLAASICPAATIAAVEIDPVAAEAARKNFAQSLWASRLRCHTGDINAYSSPVLPDIIISNPPYFITGGTSADASRAIARHQASLSYTTLLSMPLSPGGHLGMVTPADVYDSVIFESEMRRRKLCRLCRVRTSPTKDAARLLWDFTDADGDCREETLDLRDADGRYSEAYRSIVEPYYLKLSER